MPDETADEGSEEEYTYETPDVDGIEYHDTDLDVADSVLASQHFTTDEMITVTMEGGAPTGQDVDIHAQNFAAAKLDEEVMTQDGPEQLDESAVFICNDEGEIGLGILQVEDGGTIEEAIETFVDEYLNDDDQ